ncbi:hypothetical protein H7F15_13970 [Pontibacter sp. Tf4]|uniref:DUF6503 family protein n=1 Tax=Pontibacter sp. Tf4 TaxID=2761620 RepID=UPI0016258BF2|nr:DUF6503 family protein [Pontibacter sp. Tf4]MBB6612152.1 hypothetical protein [Pontibacter sp. Tf4]
MRALYFFLPIVALLMLLSGCEPEAPSAQQIVDKAIEAHGGKRFDKSIIQFRLRDKLYRSLRDNGAFVYSRTFTDTTGQHVHDVLRNSGFTRTIDNKEVELPEERKQAFSNSVNSVIYFALLPYFLNDAAVQKAYLGEVTIKGEPYYKIKVTFAQEGGGQDHEDEYVYWFHKQHHTMDYLAYNYKEDDGSLGTRFREAINPRTISGIRFQDYINYTSEEKGLNIENYDTAFEAGNLKKVSDINLEEIEVRELPE